jgi:hypothetical protein
MPDTIIAGGHNPAQDWESEVTELESRAEIASLSDLQNERRQLVAENAKLIARYGSFGMHDDYRKQFVEAQKVRARMELSAGREKKPTESEIDATAYGSEEYARFLDNALEEKVEYLRIQSKLDELSERIRSRELELLSYNAELKLAR